MLLKREDKTNWARMILQINNQSLSTSIWNNCSIITLENTGAAFQIWGNAVTISFEPLMVVTVIWVLSFCYKSLSCMKDGTVIDFPCFLYDPNSYRIKFKNRFENQHFSSLKKMHPMWMLYYVDGTEQNSLLLFCVFWQKLKRKHLPDYLKLEKHISLSSQIWIA